MKKYLLLTCALLPGAFMANAQEELDGVKILPQGYMRKITHNGETLIGQTGDGGTITYNLQTNRKFFYSSFSSGNGYPCADNGWLVGCDMYDSGQAAIMNNGKTINVTSLKKYTMSDLHSITPDATRTCGLAGGGMSLDEGHFMYEPLYCDIDADGNIGEPVFLPFPKRDYFGKMPQYCSAVWMSDDGKTILGQVTENSGRFNRYPILYKQDENGEWDYALPADKLFNMDNLPIPQDPGSFEQAFPNVVFPELKNFMTPQQYAEFEEAVDIWQASGMDPDLDPYDNLFIFMTQEQMEAYNECVDTYNDAAMTYNDMFDTYMMQLWDVIDCSVFFLQNAMALSHDGKKMAMTAVENMDLPNEVYVPWLFDLETGECKRIGPMNMHLITNQVFPDGTVIAATPAGETNPAQSYIYTPELDRFLPIQDYLSNIGSPYGEWIKKNLTGEVMVGLDPQGGYMFRTMTVSGILSASEDFSVLAAGVDGYVLDMDMYFTYVLDMNNSNVDEIVPENQEEVYRVYNLQGLNVLNTTNRDEIKNLDKGIYIINGKKVKL